MALRQSEVTKSRFTDLLNFLTRTGKSVLISGPIPTLGRGSESFSRLLSLHTWLQSVCRTHNVQFIDNFNLFWNRLPFYKPDGLHPNWRGYRMLADNLKYNVNTGSPL